MYKCFVELQSLRKLLFRYTFRLKDDPKKVTIGDVKVGRPEMLLFVVVVVCCLITYCGLLLVVYCCLLFVVYRVIKI